MHLAFYIRAQTVQPICLRFSWTFRCFIESSTKISLCRLFQQCKRHRKSAAGGWKLY